MAKKRKKLFRNASLPAIFSMALVLLLVGLFTFTFLLARDITKQVKENLNITILLDQEVNVYQKNRIKSYLDKNKSIKSYRFISKKEALSEYVDEIGTNPEEVLGWNPLKAIYEVQLKSEYAQTNTVQKMEEELLKISGVYQVDYQRSVLEFVNENVKKISLILIALAVLLAIISFALINSTIRLKIYSNRFLINTMKLVGATPWFIRKPYLKIGLLNGFVSSITALLMFFGLLFYFNREFDLNFTTLKNETIIIVSSVVFFMGIVLTSISTYFAVGRYLKMRTDDIYFA